MLRLRVATQAVIYQMYYILKWEEDARGERSCRTNVHRQTGTEGQFALAGPGSDEEENVERNCCRPRSGGGGGERDGGVTRRMRRRLTIRIPGDRSISADFARAITNGGAGFYCSRIAFPVR